MSSDLGWRPELELLQEIEVFTGADAKGTKITFDLEHRQVLFGSSGPLPMSASCSLAQQRVLTFGQKTVRHPQTNLRGQSGQTLESSK